MQLKKDTIYFQEYISIKPNYSVIYSRCLNPPNKTQRVKTQPLTKKIDFRSFKRFNNALNLLVMNSPKHYVINKETNTKHQFSLSFITLTLSDSQNHTDKEIKEILLEPMLRFIMQSKATGYCWKAEKQLNGRIHFHITTNAYIPWQRIRDKWNSLQIRYGYLNKYFDEHNHYNANSTDVKAVKNNDKAIRYIVKYMLKKESNKENIEGRTFGYSRNLANKKVIFETTEKGVDEIIEYLANIETGGLYADYFTLYKHQLIDLSKCPKLLKEAFTIVKKP